MHAGDDAVKRQAAADHAVDADDGRRRIDDHDHGACTADQALDGAVDPGVARHQPWDAPGARSAAHQQFVVGHQHDGVVSSQLGHAEPAGRVARGAHQARPRGRDQQLGRLQGRHLFDANRPQGLADGGVVGAGGDHERWPGMHRQGNRTGPETHTKHAPTTHANSSAPAGRFGTRAHPTATVQTCTSLRHLGC